MDSIVNQYNFSSHIINKRLTQYLDTKNNLGFGVSSNIIALYVNERLVTHITVENNDDIPDIIKNIINELRSYKSEDPSHVEEPEDIWLPRFMEFINTNYQTN